MPKFPAVALFKINLSMEYWVELSPDIAQDKFGITLLSDPLGIETQDGRTIRDIIDDWFSPTRINRSHVYRDGHEVGSSKTLLGVEVTEILPATE